MTGLRIPKEEKREKNKEKKETGIKISKKAQRIIVKKSFRMMNP